MCALLLYVALFLGLTFPFWLQARSWRHTVTAVDIGADQGRDASRVENVKFFDYVRLFVPESSRSSTASGPDGWRVWTDRTSWEAARCSARLPIHRSGCSPPSSTVRGASSPWWRSGPASWADCSCSSGVASSSLTAGGPVGGGQLRGVSGLDVLADGSLFLAQLVLVGRDAVWRDPVGERSQSRELERAFLRRLQPGDDGLSARHRVSRLFLRVLPAGSQPPAPAIPRWEVQGLFLSGVASAVVVAGLLALPTNLDLAVSALDSARIGVDPSFYDLYLPDVHSWSAAARLLATITVPEIFGNPISPTYPLPFDGSSVPLLVTFLALCALVVPA